MIYDFIKEGLSAFSIPLNPLRQPLWNIVNRQSRPQVRYNELDTHYYFGFRSLTVKPGLAPLFDADDVHHPWFSRYLLTPSFSCFSERPDCPSAPIHPPAITESEVGSLTVIRQQNPSVKFRNIGLAYMTQTNFAVKTFEDLIAARVLTGATRIAEHFLINGITSISYTHEWLVKEFQLPQVLLVSKHLESLGFIIEMRYTDPGTPELDVEEGDRDDTIDASFNAYHVVDNHVRSLINLTVAGNRLIVSTYQASTEINYLPTIAGIVSKWVVTKPIKISYYTGFDGSGRPIVDIRELDKELNRPADCFYPSIEEGVEALAKGFLESKNNLLFLMSDPGMGKSTLIRELLRHYKNRPLVQFAGEKVITHPSFDPTLAGLPANAVCVIEDADSLVSRRTEGNTVMSLFLNEIDGIASKGIKFIVSTNLPNRKSVDPALFRAGRDYKTIEFRPLSRSQAEKILISQELSLDKLDTLSFPCTLAELLADGGDTKQKSSGPGFNLT